jgi:hypothetical protein
MANVSINYRYHAQQIIAINYTPGNCSTHVIPG